MVHSVTQELVPTSLGVHLAYFQSVWLCKYLPQCVDMELAELQTA